MSLLDDINLQKKKNIQTYLNDVNRLFSDYEQERQTTEDYNGRQILELLQNADDAQSTEVQIELDSNNCLLVISNVGDPFSKEGFESLMLAHNSSKRNKKLYIGNKGLGFRSILNWAEKIDIVSNGCKVSFSQDVVADCVNTDLAEKCDEIETIKIKKQYDSAAFTYPILALPKIQENLRKSSWTTEIIIQYKEKYLEDIKKQLAALSPEVLLFVRHMELLRIIENGETKEYRSDFEKEEKFCNVYLTSKINGTVQTDCLYRVFKRTGKLPLEYQENNKYNEALHYEIAVAIGDDFEVEKNSLYSFFKTDIEIPLPCIIHGSFDLNSSRTSINNTGINDFILRKVARELLFIALFIRNDSVNATWNSFELLRFRHLILLDKLEEFEKLLNKYKSEAGVLPCVDEKYRPLSDVIYYSDEMSSLVAENYGKYFVKILKVKQIGTPWNDLGLNAGKKYTEEYFWKTFDSICKNDDLSIDARANLIVLLGNLIENRRLTNNGKFKISILIDDDEKVIDKDYLIYTPAPYKINKPSYMDIQFIGKDFYKKLSRAFNVNGEHQDRQLCAKIGSFVNLKPYDLAELTPNIIRTCNELVKDAVDPLPIIMETIVVLYRNHLLSKTMQSGSETKYEGVYLLNRKKEITQPSSLYFSKTYENGLQTETIYGDIIPDSEYLVDKDFWNIEDEDQLEDFFILLGVSKDVKYDRFQLSEANKDYYAPLLKDCKEYHLYQNHGPHNVVSRLVDLQKIERMSPSKILLLLFSDYNLRLELNAPRLKFDKSGYKGKYDYPADYSYVAYQLKPIFEKVVANIDDKDIDCLIDEKTKLDYDFLERNGLKKEHADELLRRLYAKKDLSELDTEIIYSMLAKVPSCFPDGRNVQKVYNRILDILKTRELGNPPQGLFLACHIGDDFEYKLCKDIYYYDDAVLPKSILREIPTLVMRQRAGCDNVVRVFGVRKLTADALDIKESAVEKNKPLSDSFHDYLKKHRACILAYRMLGVNDCEKKKEETRRLINLKINLISTGNFSFDGETREFEDYDFISKGDDAYIKVPNLDFGTLINKLDFLDACAEVLMMQFRLEDIKLKKTFRDVINSDVDDTEKEIRSDYGMDYLRECKELLGENETPEIIFWNRVLNAKGLPLFVDSGKKSVKEYVEDVLSINLPNTYGGVVFFDVQNEAFIDLLRMVKEKTGVLLSRCLTKDGLTIYHKGLVRNSILDNMNKFTSLLWKKTNALPREEIQPRIDFKNIVWAFRNCDNKIDFSEYSFELDIDYNEIVVGYARKNFGIDLDQEDEEPYHEKYLYDLPDGNETALPNELAGLVYFEGYDAQFEQFVAETTKVSEKNGGALADGGLPNACPPSNIEVSVVKISPTEVKKAPLNGEDKGSPGIPRNYSPTADRTRQEHGKSAQETVVQWLEESGSLYRERSSTSQSVDKDDGAHYDIDYKPKGETGWRFLEVKHVSSDSFDITENEIKFACLPGNKTRYDLALVKDGKVYPVKAPFANETEDSFVKRFNAEIMGYSVKFKMIADSDVC